MEMLSGEQITAAGLADWRKLGQGLHARFVIRDFRAGAQFISAIADAGEARGIILRFGWTRLRWT